MTFISLLPEIRGSRKSEELLPDTLESVARKKRKEMNKHKGQSGSLIEKEER